MPDVDYIMICDYVHADPSGKQYILGAGFDRVMAVSVPTAQAVGLPLRLLHTPSECGQDHTIEVVFSDEDGQRLLEMRATYKPEIHPEYVPGDLVGATLALNARLVLPKYGRYSFELLVDNTSKKAIPFTVVPMPDASQHPPVPPAEPAA